MGWVPNRRVVVDPQAAPGEVGIAAAVPSKGIVRSRWSAADPAFAAVLRLIGGGGFDGDPERFVAAGLLVQDGPPAPVRFRVVAAPPPDWQRAHAPPLTEEVRATLAEGAEWFRATEHTMPLPFWLGGAEPTTAEPLKPAAYTDLDAIARDGFGRLPPLVPPFFAAELGRYYAALTQAGALTFDAAMRRVVAYDEPLGTFWHAVMTPRVAACVGRPLQATFSYVAGYQYDAVLGPHTDRDACTWTMSWMLDEGLGTGPEPRVAWPLWVRAADGREVALPLAVGEAALMRGHELTHWRTPLAELGPDRHATLLIFCWTEAS